MTAARIAVMNAECVAAELERALEDVQLHVAGTTPTIEQIAALAADDATLLLRRIHSLRRRLECEVPSADAA